MTMNESGSLLKKLWTNQMGGVGIRIGTPANYSCLAHSTRLAHRRRGSLGTHTSGGNDEKQVSRSAAVQSTCSPALQSRGSLLEGTLRGGCGEQVLG